MKSNKYWIDRALEREDRANRDANIYLRELKKQYEKAMLDIEKEISIFYGKYAEDNSVSFEKAQEYLSPKERVKFKDRLDYFIELVQKNPKGKFNTEIRNMSNRVRITRYQALLTEIRAHIDMLFGDKYNGYEPRTTSLLSNTYEESYYRTKYDTAIGLGVGKAFSGLNQNAITEAINYPWSGANYSNRIWEQKAKLITNLNNTITQGMVQGSSIDKMTSELSQKTDVGYTNAQRLIRTESNHVLNNGVLKSYVDDGMDQYEYVATLDSRTSEICQSLDNKIFDIDKARPGVNFPPMHVNCRSTTVAYFDDEDRADYERIAKGEDGKYYKVTADMNYQTWYNKYVEPNNYSKVLSGFKTTNGIEINGVKKHLLERSIERNVEIENIRDALINPLYTGGLKTNKDGKVSQRFIGKSATVNINPETGYIITTWRTGKSTVKKYKGR